MRAIKKILVPVDGSVGGCKAVDEALFIAEKCDAELDFVYVASNINKYRATLSLTASGRSSRMSARRVNTSRAGTLRGAFSMLRMSRAAI